MTADRYDELVGAFLAKRRIAIWDTEPPDDWLVRRLGRHGADVFAVGPGCADDPAARSASSLTRIDPPVEAVLVYVDREQTMAAVEDCVKVRVPLVWLHDALSPGSAVPEAIEQLRAAGCAVIPGLCPVFYLKPVDPVHACLKWVLRLTGKERRTRRQAG